MTRLRYYSVSDVIYTDWFTIGPNLIIRAIINTETFKYQITELNTDVVYEGKGKDLRSAKAQVKSAMLKAGVNFSEEIRKRK
jgi:hypothetical protein